MIGAAFTWTTWIFVACAIALAARLAVGPTTVDRLTALAAVSALVLAVLTMSGTMQGRAAFLDVALVYDIFGFLGILAIATYTKAARRGDGGSEDEPRPEPTREEP